MAGIWNIATGQTLATLIERTPQNLLLPLANNINPTLKVISGKLPSGLRLEGNFIVGTVLEVSQERISTFVIRATLADGSFEDRTFQIIVSGADEPQWITNDGLLPVGSGGAFFVLDNVPLDFQLQVRDTDLSAGDELEFFIADGDGELPPGIQLTTDGRLVGVVEPILALDKAAGAGFYDENVYGTYPFDFGIKSSNGFASFFYDSTFYDFNIPTKSPNKLNRNFAFVVSVSDGDTIARRLFRIYLVGDDFLRADNTVMQVANGVFTADNTHIRTPIWLTPSNLGYKRANNYVTIFLDTLETDTLLGVTTYAIRPENPDGTPSILPPGLSINSITGELFGRVPYQPAITKEYKFTIRAQRFAGQTETVEVTATFYEDTLLGATSFKIFKLPKTLDDGIDDLRALVDQEISINNKTYKVKAIDDTNEDYDLIILDKSLDPFISIILKEKAVAGQSHLFATRFTESQKSTLINRYIRFSDTEAYRIRDIYPYISYRIVDENLQTIDIANDFVLQKLLLNNQSWLDGRTYNVGDFVYYDPNTTDQVASAVPYICKVAHTADSSNRPDLGTAEWAVPTVNDNLQKFHYLFNEENIGPAYINIINNSDYIIKIPRTGLNLIKNRLTQIFTSDGSLIEITVYDDTQDRIILDTGLTRTLNLNRNIGIALLSGGSFSKEFSGVESDGVNNPFKDKTFTVKIIGEIESTIRYITNSDLGTINANFPSDLRIEAVTTVPDSRLVYTIIDGKLPNGLTLTYSGEIIGKAYKYPTGNFLGLTSIDKDNFTLDGGETTLDRLYTFTVNAQDRFGFSAVERTFTLRVNDQDRKLYSNIYIEPLLKESNRLIYSNFVANPDIFPPEVIYRPNDPEFGIKKKIRMLMYAGIEQKTIEYFVGHAAKYHKRRRFQIGEFKTAVAKYPGSNDIVYEVVYAEVLDPAEPRTGSTRKKFRIKNNQQITVDAMDFESKDDTTLINQGLNSLQIDGRGADPILYLGDTSLEVLIRNGTVIVQQIDNFEVLVDTRTGALIDVDLIVNDSEPYKRRPINPLIKTDNDGIDVSQDSDVYRYISNITNMREELEGIGDLERNYLPLWMRTAQNLGEQELDFVPAIPIAYCKPGTAQQVLLNIKNSNVNLSQIDFEFDRYIVDNTEGVYREQYIVFPNYNYNV